MVSIFYNWGKFITSHPWVIIALWIVILVVSLPLAGSLGNDLQYNENSFVPKNLESIKAMDQYNALFVHNNSTDSEDLMVAIDSGNHTMNHQFIENVNNSIHNSANFTNVSRVTSAYSAQVDALMALTPKLHDLMFDLYDQVHDGSVGLWDAFDIVKEANAGMYAMKDQAGLLSSQIYTGIETTRASSQTLYENRNQVVLANAGLYQIKSANPGMNDSQVIDAFMAAQNLTSPDDRARLIAIYGLGASPSPADVDKFILSMAAQMMPGTDPKAMAALYALGPNPSTAALGDYVLAQATAGMDATKAQFARDLYSLGRLTNDKLDNFVLSKAYEGKNDTERQSIKAIWDMGASPSDQTISDYVMAQAKAGRTATEQQMLDEIYGLGRRPGIDTINLFVTDKVASEMNLSGNHTYLLALLGQDRDMSGPEMAAFVQVWVYQHGFSDPEILPESLLKNMITDRLTLFLVTFNGSYAQDDALDAVPVLRKIVSDQLSTGQYPGLKAYVTGSQAFVWDTENATGGDMSKMDIISVVLILVILGVYFRSFLTPIVPLAIIAFAIMGAFAIMDLITHTFDVYYLAQTLMMVIMLGAGTDYCVFMLARYSEERAAGHDVKTSVLSTVEHSGKSIASSGCTAMIGVGSLCLINSGLFQSLGIGMALGIFASMLVALSLLPAVMTVVGDRMYWPAKLYKTEHRHIVTSFWRKVTRKVIKHARVLMAISIILIIPSVYLFSTLNLSNDFTAMMPKGIDSRTGFELIEKEFGTGNLAKITVLVTMPYDITDASGNMSVQALDQTERVSQIVAGSGAIGKVQSATRPYGDTINYRDMSGYSAMDQAYYQSNIASAVGKDHHTTALSVSFDISPYSVEASRAIDQIRADLKSYGEGEGKGVVTLVGGSPAGTKDFQDMAFGGFTNAVPIVLFGIFLVLLIGLRSIFTPIRLIITLLMTIGWTLAIYVILFQNGMGMPSPWTLPIILFCTLMGLGIDYDIFLVSRVREEVLNGKPDEEAIEHAVETTGSIITLCGFIMAATFGSMMLTSQVQMQEMGFVLCLAVILDATIMRLVLVPAIMVMMKKYNWWLPSLSMLRKRPKGGPGEEEKKQV